MRRVGVGLGDVVAADPHRLERAGDRAVQHLGHLQAALTLQRDAPALLELPSHHVVLDVAVGGVRVGERAHVGRALDVVLAAQRQQCAAGLADLAGEQREIADQLHALRAVQLLGDAEAPRDGGALGGAVELGCAHNVGGGDAGDLLDRLGRIRADDVGEPVEALEPLADERLVDEAVADDDVGEPVEERRVRAGPQRAVQDAVVGELDAPRVGRDQLRAVERRLLHARARDRMALGRVGADDQQDVGVLDVVERSGAARQAERLAQAV